MNKVALEIDPAVVGRHAAGGAMLGMSAAGLIELAHSVSMARRRAKADREPTETDENTIVLTLPKRAEVKADKATTAAVETTKAGDYVINRGKQSRHVKGQFGPNLAKAASGWPTLTASALAAIAGTAGGAALVSRIAAKQREKRMKEELAQARQEYLDMLSGGAVKGASVIEDMFGGFEPEGEKQAGDTFGMLNYPLAAMAILTILGGGATGYLTKRVLDEQFQATNKATKDIPKVKRIVFRSAPETDPAKMASADECRSCAAGLLVMMDRVSGTYRFTDMPYVKEALDKSGLTKEALVGQASDWERVRGTLDADPNLAQALARIYSDSTTANPFARFFKRTMLSMPGLGKHMANKGINDFIAKMQGAGDTGVKAAALRPGGLGAAMLGGALGTAVGGDRITKDELAKMIEEAQAKADAERSPRAEADTVSIGGADPAAKAYVGANGPKIQALVRRLASEGQI